MKKLFAILIVLCFSLCSVAQRNIDVLHYSYQLDLTDIDDSIYGRAVITYVLKKGNTIAEFDLVKGNKNEKGMVITNITLP